MCVALLRSRQRSLNTVAMTLFDHLVILSNALLKRGADGGFPWQIIPLFDVALSICMIVIQLLHQLSDFSLRSREICSVITRRLS